jgi:hypothetical protein
MGYCTACGFSIPADEPGLCENCRGWRRIHRTVYSGQPPFRGRHCLVVVWLGPDEEPVAIARAEADEPELLFNRTRAMFLEHGKWNQAS